MKNRGSITAAMVAALFVGSTTGCATIVKGGKTTLEVNTTLRV